MKTKEIFEVGDLVTYKITLNKPIKCWGIITRIIEYKDPRRLKLCHIYGVGFKYGALYSLGFLRKI